MSKKYEYDYPLPAVTVDMAIFTIRKQTLKVLLIQRRDDPHKGSWAIPGGFVEVGVGHKSRGKQGENLEEAAERELLEETNLQRERDQVFLEQLYTFGNPGRDPRGRVITVAYYALISPEAYHRVEAGDDAVEAAWYDVEELPEMAFDHDEIMATAIERVRGKIDYDPRLARALLPSEFTTRQFRRVHEICKGTTYDSSNFNKRFKRMVEDGRILETEDLEETTGAGRPARLYKFPE
jgi:8-oxo-dGTP diphosphatase